MFDFTTVGKMTTLQHQKKNPSQMVKEQRQKKAKTGFLDCSETPHKAPNWHAISLRDIIVYCIPYKGKNEIVFLSLFFEFYPG